MIIINDVILTIILIINYIIIVILQRKKKIAFLIIVNRVKAVFLCVDTHKLNKSFLHLKQL